MKYIITLVVAAFALVGCENIKEGDRYEPVDKLETKRVVLLEEFTGVKCTNCPAAAEIAHDLIELFPENLVVVGMHGENTGTYGLPYKGEQDFRLDGVKELFDAVGGTASQGYPCGMINRLEDEGTLFQNADTWAGHVVDELVKEAILDINIEKAADFDISADEVKVNIEIETIGELKADDYALVVQVTEDGIQGTQYNHGEHDSTYIHNHVLRSFVNGTWGESVKLADKGDKVSVSATIEFKDEWVRDNCSVVAYVYSSKTKRNVIQAAIMPMGNKTNH